MRILLVDDDEFVRSILSNVLCGLGHIDEAENGMEAVYRFEEARKEGKPYNLILMDYQMPLMDGCEALCIIRMLEKEQTPDKVTTVYISSGYAGCRNEFSSRIDLDPYIKFIGKPFNFSLLIDDIRRMGF